MLLSDARKLAIELMTKHGLIAKGWTFGFDGAKRSLGRCYLGRNLITLSRHFVELNGEDLFRDTLLHECAHGLVGPGHGHDRVWKLKCLEIGCRPSRLSQGEVIRPKYRYEAVCPSCGKKFHSHRKIRKSYYCLCKGKRPIEKPFLVYHLIDEIAAKIDIGI